MRARTRAGIAAVVCLALVASTPAAASAGSGAASSAPRADEIEPSERVVVEPGDRTDLASEAADLVSAMTLRDRAASLVMGHIPTTDPAAARAYMESTGIGGFILMGANVPASEDELRALTRAMAVDSALPPLLAIDQEGGDVSRLPWDDFPSARVLKSQPPAASRDAFAGRSALVARAGIGVNFGVVADITDDPSMFIFSRALGTSPEGGAERVAEAVTGESGSVLSTLKHFPGHGAAPGDSHAGIPSTGESKDDWRGSDGAPFAAGIDAGAPLLMYGHLAYTAVDPAPASLSAEWHRIAREELGFDGIAITDDLGMLQASGDPDYADPVANAVAAVAAGNDMVLAVMFSQADSAARITDGIVAAVESGALPQARVDEAAERVALARLQLAADGAALIPCGDCEPAR